MIEAVLEFVWQIIFDILLVAPGAFILRLASGFEMPQSEMIEKHQSKSALVGVVFWILMMAIIGITARSL